MIESINTIHFKIPILKSFKHNIKINLPQGLDSGINFIDLALMLFYF